MYLSFFESFLTALLANPEVLKEYSKDETISLAHEFAEKSVIHCGNFLNEINEKRLQVFQNGGIEIVDSEEPQETPEPST